MKKRLVVEKDYTAALLPHTRKEVFFDICRLYSGSLLQVGLILLAFAIPLIVIGHLANENEAAYLIMVQAAEEPEEKLDVYRGFQLADSVFSLLDIIGYMFLSVGLSGAARIIRQHAWEEPVNLKLDFLKGIRQNGRAYLILSFLAGGWISFSRYCFEGALYAQAGQILLNLLPLFLGVLVFLPVFGFAVVNIAIYSNTFGQNLRISFLLYLKRPVVASGIGFLLAMVFFFPTIIPLAPPRLLFQIAIILFAPFAILVWFLWCYKQLDIYVNCKHYPELVGRGLAVEDAGEQGRR